MKKVIYTALLMTGLSIGTFAKTVNDEGKEAKNNAPAKVKYSSELADAENVVWSSSPRFKKATFVKDGVQTTAFYNRLNEYVATTQLVEITTLSPAAIKALIKNYPGYQMGEIIKYTGTDEAYFVNLRNDKENFLVKISSDSTIGYFKDLK
ncbi:hypothetical protein AAE02nite_42480 [Adhaeribacter aerolatus]|uniref:Beta-lactamase-inhibitor-like PepSY-like domain-containing protein n=1 Tax=Adhaeribacter aerolatus TaxID=670289 RepID=A0A512B3P9_9BACT|nr:hypothetical protein [Adhaeribacter aerolatus]GEO06584.1 hypothetical protein AAE02nite_42480 [Adhaeribacter aerolatus]